MRNFTLAADFINLRNILMENNFTRETIDHIVIRITHEQATQLFLRCLPFNMEL